MDSKIVQVSLNGLENILRLGEQEAKQNGTGINPYCALIEEAYGNAGKPPTQQSWAFFTLRKVEMFFCLAFGSTPTVCSLQLGGCFFHGASLCFQERLSLKKCQIKVKALCRKCVCEGRRQRLDVLSITSFFSMLVFLSHTASILPDYSLRSFLTSKVGGQNLCPASVHISGVKSFLITYKKFKLAAFLHRWLKWMKKINGLLLV